MIDVHLRVVAQQLAVELQSRNNLLAREGPAADTVEGDLEAPLLELQDISPVLVILQTTACECVPRWVDPHRLGRSDPEIAQEIVNGPEVRNGPPLGVIDDGECKTGSIWPKHVMPPVRACRSLGTPLQP